MQEILDEIVADLISLDPELAKIEGEIRKLAQKMLAAKPDSEIDEKFKQALKSDLMARAEKLKEPLKSSSNPFQMQKLFYSLAGAAVAVAIFFGIQNYDQIFSSELTLKDTAGLASLDFEQKITPVGERAFGSLAQEAVADEARGLGGGGGLGIATESVDGDMAESKIAPMPDFEVYKYVYNGPLNFPIGSVEVLRRIREVNSGDSLARQLAQLDLGLVDLASLQNLKLENFNLSEDRDYGYSTFVSFTDGSISINQNWQKWPDPYADCRQSDCWESLRLTRSDMLPDSQAISIANDFVRKFNVNLQSYGEPEIQYSWERELERFQGAETDYYFPDSVSVVYPLKIGDKFVYSSGGTKDGVSVSVNQRFDRASGLYGLYTQNYESSQYAAVSDEALFRKFLERGGFWGGYYPEGGRVVEVQLGTPEEVLLHYWNYTDGENEELILPALRFPIASDNPNVYQEAVVVPLVAEILQERDAIEPPVPMPFLEIEEAPVADEVLERTEVEGEAE
ncbi:MAG: hypothetical protein K9L85_03730 [Candidatus Peribacteraceae bacterium]|nr:hypothetical protein [Candidatus Peribacteraceae bacterium]